MLQVLPIPTFFLNSIVASTLTTVLNVLVASMAAYPLAKMRFRGRDAIFYLLLATLIVPAQLTYIPSFILLVNVFHYYDTLPALIWPSLASAFNIFLLRQAFRGVPNELIDAARVDGARDWRIWWQILLPIVRPSVATVAIFTFVTSWNDFLWPSLMLQTMDGQDAAGRAGRAPGLLRVGLPGHRGRGHDDGRADPALLRRPPALLRPRPERRGQGMSAGADLVGERIAARTFDGLEPTADVLAAIGAGASGRREPVPRQERVDAGPGPGADRRAPGGPAARRAAAPHRRRPGGRPAPGDRRRRRPPGRATWPSRRPARRRSPDACGEAIALELAAMGVTVVFAPVCDLLSAPESALMGTRTFGDDPETAGRHGGGDGPRDPGTGRRRDTQALPRPRLRDRRFALRPAGRRGGRGDAARTRARAVPGGIRAGARLVMLAHLAVPAVTGGRVVAATIAPEIAVGLLRDELGFTGVSATDALDMGAMGPLDALPEIVSQSVRAGVDLMLALHPFELEERALDRLIGEAADGSLDIAALRASRRRIRALRRWLGRAPAQPDIEVVGSAAHAALAREIADRAVTLVRDRPGLVPLRPPSDGPWRIVVIAPRPVDLTPADTSSYAARDLADALRDALRPVRAVRVRRRARVPARPGHRCDRGARPAATDSGTVTLVGHGGRRGPSGAGPARRERSWLAGRRSSASRSERRSTSSPTRPSARTAAPTGSSPRTSTRWPTRSSAASRSAAACR